MTATSDESRGLIPRYTSLNQGSGAREKPSFIVPWKYFASGVTTSYAERLMPRSS